MKNKMKIKMSISRLKANGNNNPQGSISQSSALGYSTLMPFGKYKGKMIADIINEDKQYIEWLISKNILFKEEVKRKISEQENNGN